MIWIIIALLSAVFTSLTTITAKLGIRKVNSNFAMGYRTFIVIICSLVICLISGSIYHIHQLALENWIFLILSGLATGCSWLCYYKALKIGDVNKVAPIDKSSFILSSILFLIFFFDETTNNGNPLTIIMLLVSITLIGVGTILMITPQKKEEVKNNSWIFFAVLSSVFAALVSLLVKMGLRGTSSDLGTLIRTIIVFIFASTIVIFRKDYRDIQQIDKKSWLFLTISGLMTGGAWLTEYTALNMHGVNPVAVSSIGKLAILLTMAFSFLFLKEKYTKKTLFGLFLLTLGIVVIIIFSL